jgi:glycogen(starch) synthase
MRILISSHAFSPSVGGIETASGILGREWLRLGHEVRIVTRTPDPASDPHPFPVIRKPSASTLLREVGWCDVFFQNNVSLGTLWAGLLLRKPTVITHQTWIGPGAVGSVKRGALRLVRARVAITRAVAGRIPSDHVIPNPYRDDLFQPRENQVRQGDILFVGRLVSDKGCDLLLDALAMLASRGLHPGVSLIGSGPLELSLRDRAIELGLGAQVRWKGPLEGADLAREYGSHRILAVPSRWDEPFGIVALEGIACGCRVVASDAGGLPEATGPCGTLFRAGDPASLADALQAELLRPDHADASAFMHLERHRPATVALEYLGLFSKLINSSENRETSGNR